MNPWPGGACWTFLVYPAVLAVKVTRARRAGALSKQSATWTACAAAGLK